MITYVAVSGQVYNFSSSANVRLISCKYQKMRLYPASSLETLIIKCVLNCDLLGFQPSPNMSSDGYS